MCRITVTLPLIKDSYELHNSLKMQRSGRGISMTGYANVQQFAGGCLSCSAWNTHMSTGDGCCCTWYTQLSRAFGHVRAGQVASYS